MKKFLLFSFVLFLSFAASAQKLVINGTVSTPEPGKMALLSFRHGEEMVSDSAEIHNGKFQIITRVEEPTIAFFGIKYQSSKSPTGMRQERMQLFVEPGTMNIIVTDSLKFAKIAGSKAHKDFEKLLALQKPFDNTLRALNRRYMELRREKNEDESKMVVMQMDSISKKIREEVVKTFFEKNTSSPIAFYVLQQYAGYDIDPKEIEPMFLQLPVLAQKTPSGQAFKQAIETAKKTAVGAYAMDFTQNDTVGKPVSLSSFRGKYVLVDFWASWCGPCRAENPNLVKAFNQYKDKNFTVLGVSLDRPGAKDKWMEAIHKDGLTWTHVSDLKFWDNEVARQYGIRAIPQNLLIDPEGKIIAKNIRGEELQQKMAEIIK